MKYVYFLVSTGDENICRQCLLVVKKTSEIIPTMNAVNITTHYDPQVNLEHSENEGFLIMRSVC